MVSWDKLQTELFPLIYILILNYVNCISRGKKYRF